MKRIVESVPNFSEGRDPQFMQAVTKAVESVPGVSLLSLEPDGDYNRVVVTFVGEPEPVTEAAFQATKTATALIDMRTQKGEHPRLGAADVVPFVPVSGVSMAECVECANVYGKRIADELGIPAYLYEAAARVPERRNLSNIRKGEYEGLAARITDPAWKPDFGKPVFNEKSGATVTGARNFLIAYNVNLNTPDKDIAHQIALRIREIGHTVKDAQGNATKFPGTLKNVKAMGVHLDRVNIAQVSINLTNFHITSPHAAFEEVKRFALELGVEVTGSEVIGLIPKEAILMAGRFYGGDTIKSEKDLIEIASKSLGLSQLDPFIPEKKIIEYMI